MRRIPVPGLLLCAKLLGPNDLPKGAATYLASTLTAVPRSSGRTSAISVAAARGWKLNDADVTISDGSRTFEYAGHRQLDEGMEVSFAPSLDSRTDGEPGKELKMTVRYPGTPPIRVVLLDSENDIDQPTADPRGNRLPILSNAFGTTRTRESNRIFRIQEIEVDGVRLSLQTPSQEAGEIRVLKPEFPDSENSTRS